MCSDVVSCIVKTLIQSAESLPESSFQLSLYCWQVPKGCQEISFLDLYSARCQFSYVKQGRKNENAYVVSSYS